MSTTTYPKRTLRKAGQGPARKTEPGAEARAGSRSVRLRRVFVHDMEIVGSIGVYEHEKRYEQRILISADLWVVDDYDGRSDRLVDVLDYGKVMDDIVRIAEGGHVNLNETLAERIAEQCLADARVEGVRIRIAKPDVARSCKAVGIEIERWRGE